MSEFELWAWMSRDETGWCQIGAILPGFGNRMANLTFRKRDTAMALEGVARQHARSTGQEVQLVHFVGEPAQRSA